MSLQSQQKIHITLDLAWNKLSSAKQTVFPVEGEKENRKPIRGPPTSKHFTLRATKGVNFHPHPYIALHYENGVGYFEPEILKISIVSAIDKTVPAVGACPCGKAPTLSESKRNILEVNELGETFATIRGGQLELSKVQIACCSGHRGHGVPFCIKIEFVREGSPLQGRVIYSLPIEVGAKGPFAKIISKSQKSQKREREREREREKSPEMAIVVPSASYEGAEQIVTLLSSMNLQKYIPLFVKHEIDLESFVNLTESDLISMGIELVGPRVKIMKEISRIRDVCAPYAVQTVSSEPDISITTLGSALSSDVNNNTADNEPGTKRRRLTDSSSSFVTPITPASNSEDKLKNLSIYVYLGDIVPGKSSLKKILYMVKSRRNLKETNEIVMQMQRQILPKYSQDAKRPLHEGEPPQLMLVLQPNKNGDWSARSQFTDKIWEFKKGDYIKIDNRHSVGISINIHYFYIPDATSVNGNSIFIEDTKSPKAYPVLFPGASLEIGIDEYKDGKLALASQFDAEVHSNTFAISQHGRLVPTDSNVTDACIFSFKRRKDSPPVPALPISNTGMKKVDSLDDFQKELFLARCLDPETYMSA